MTEQNNLCEKCFKKIKAKEYSKQYYEINKARIKNRALEYYHHNRNSKKPQTIPAYETSRLYLKQNKAIIEDLKGKEKKIFVDKVMLEYHTKISLAIGKPTAGLLHIFNIMIRNYALSYFIYDYDMRLDASQEAYYNLLKNFKKLKSEDPNLFSYITQIIKNSFNASNNLWNHEKIVTNPTNKKYPQISLHLTGY